MVFSSGGPDGIDAWRRHRTGAGRYLDRARQRPGRRGPRGPPGSRRSARRHLLLTDDHRVGRRGAGGPDQRGERVLVTGAAGAVGSLCVQCAGRVCTTRADACSRSARAAPSSARAAPSGTRSRSRAHTGVHPGYRPPPLRSSATGGGARPRRLWPRRSSTGCPLRHRRRRRTGPAPLSTVDASALTERPVRHRDCVHRDVAVPLLGDTV